MTPEERQRNTKIKRIARKLIKLADEADDLELMLPNGGIVGSQLKGIALDLEYLKAK